MLHAALGVWFALAAPEAAPGVAPASATAPGSTAEPGALTDKAAAPAKTVPAVDINADTPPPSSYDRVLAQQGKIPEPPQEETRSLLEQLVRTVVSLGFVVALIYLIAKIWLARLNRGRGPSQSGLRVVERMPLDAKHSLFVVEVSGKQRFLIGAGGDKGVTFLAALESQPAAPEGSDFEGALERTQEQGVPTPPGEGQS